MIRNTFLVGLAALLGAGCSNSTQQARPNVAASSSCTQSVAADGADLIPKVYHAEVIKRPRLRTRAYTLEELAGVKLFVLAEQGMTASYLHRAASCHAVAQGPEAHPNDPLRPPGGVDSIEVREHAGSFILAVTSSDDKAAEIMWQRARALTRGGQVDVQQVGQRSEPTSKKLLVRSRRATTVHDPT